MKRYLLPLVIFVFLPGCNIDRNSSKQAAQEVSSEIEQLTKAVGDFVKQAEVPEEFKKLQQFEYQVFTWPVDKSAKEMQEKLNELGRERWDCFHFERLDNQDAADELQVFCKRRPDTPFKYVPKNFIGG